MQVQEQKLLLQQIKQQIRVARLIDKQVGHVGIKAKKANRRPGPVTIIQGPFTLAQQ